MIGDLLKKKPREEEVKDDINALVVRKAEAEASTKISIEYANSLESQTKELIDEIKSLKSEAIIVSSELSLAKQELSAVNGQRAGIESTIHAIAPIVQEARATVSNYSESLTSVWANAISGVDAFVVSEVDKKSKSIEDEINTSKKILDVIKSEIKDLADVKGSFESVIKSVTENINDAMDASKLSEVSALEAVSSVEQASSRIQAVSDKLVSTTAAAGMTVEDIYTSIGSLAGVVSDLKQTLQSKIDSVIAREVAVSDKERMLAQREQAVETLVQSITRNVQAPYVQKP